VLPALPFRAAASAAPQKWLLMTFVAARSSMLESHCCTLSTSLLGAVPCC
jgi:hypothetical protein